jgi:hypothetical protein
MPSHRGRANNVNHDVSCGETYYGSEGLLTQRSLQPPWEQRDGFGSIPKIVPKRGIGSESTQIHLVALREAKTSAVLICLHYCNMFPRKKHYGSHYLRVPCERACGIWFRLGKTILIRHRPGQIRGPQIRDLDASCGETYYGSANILTQRSF